MDGKKRARGEEKAAVRTAPPAGRGDADASPSPARAARKASLPDAAPPAVHEEPVEIVGGGAEEDDDEQVERFYALLANIRAMRGLPPCVVAAASSCGGGDAGGGGVSSRKRLRAAEPPWRPTFRMEDFEPAALLAPPSSKRERARGGADDDGDGENETGARPVVVAPSSSLPHAAVRSDSGCYKD